MRSQFIIFYVLPLLAVSACEKVIDIDLNSVSPVLVVEGGLSDHAMDTIRLTRTLNFDEKNNFPPVTGAVLSISDDIGNSILIPEVSPGLYFYDGNLGVAGRLYTLEITTDRESCTGISRMPFPVEIDSLYIDKGLFGSKNIKVQFHDSAGIENYYRILFSVNGIKDRSIEISTDLLQDGEDITYYIFEDNEDLNQGDTLLVHLQSIDKPVYDFFRTLSLSRGGGQQTAPANPISNISDHSLGYFSAYAVRSKSIIIP